MATVDEIKKAKRDDLEAIAPEYGVDPDGKNVDELRSAILEQAEAGSSDEDTDADEGDSAEGADSPDEGSEGDDSDDESDEPDESDDDSDEDEGSDDDADEGDEDEADADDPNVAADEQITAVVPNAAELAVAQANNPEVKAPKPVDSMMGHPTGFTETGEPTFGESAAPSPKGKGKAKKEEA